MFNENMYYLLQFERLIISWLYRLIQPFIVAFSNWWFSIWYKIKTMNNLWIYDHLQTANEMMLFKGAEDIQNLFLFDHFLHHVILTDRLWSWNSLQEIMILTLSLFIIFHFHISDWSLILSLIFTFHCFVRRLSPVCTISYNYCKLDKLNTWKISTKCSIMFKGLHTFMKIDSQT
jgi:hypothetical protein